MKNAIIVIAVVIAVFIIGYAMWPGGEDPAPEPAPEPVTPAPTLPAPEPADPTPREPPEEPRRQAAEPEPEPEVSLPPLADSDAFVRERLAPMDLPEAWVEQGDYVRRLAVLAENAGRGTYPRRQLEFLEPASPFRVVERGDRVFVDPASYRRYDRYVAELTEVDPDAVAGLLETLTPLVEAALQEVGVAAPPGDVFGSALREVLEVPVLSAEVELVQPHVMYEYADPEIEALSPLQKQVLRMGPDNVRALQEYLRAVAVQMRLDV